MAAEQRLILASRSVAEDLAFIALRDVAEVVAERGVTDARVIGGHMVMLHVFRYGLGADLYRTTADADLGIAPFVAREGGVLEALEARGYERFTGNRFRRRISTLEGRAVDSFAVVDVLVPAYTSHAREDRVVSDKLTTIEVPGLALALSRPPTEVRLDAVLSDGTELPVSVILPDEASAFVLKRSRGTVERPARTWSTPGGCSRSCSPPESHSRTIPRRTWSFRGTSSAPPSRTFVRRALSRSHESRGWVRRCCRNGGRESRR